MRVLHAALLLRKSAGILAQMEAERRTAAKLGLPWQTFVFGPGAEGSAVSVPTLGGQRGGEVASASGSLPWMWFNERARYYSWLNERIRKVDVALVRYSVHDPFLWGFLRSASVPVFLVHHSLEVPELRVGGKLLGTGRAAAETFLGPLTIGRAAGVVGVTPQIARSAAARGRLRETVSHVYPNGIDGESEVLRDSRSGPPKLLFTASQPYPWHGFDRLVSALVSTSRSFELHVVGAGFSEYDKQLSHDVRFHFHGQQNHGYLRSLSASMDAGLSSFGLDRIGLTEACPLKTREYLAAGLPVIAGHRDVFPEDFRAFSVVPAVADSIIDVALSYRAMSRGEVAEESMPYIEKGTLMRQLSAALSRQLGGGQ